MGLPSQYNCLSMSQLLGKINVFSLKIAESGEERRAELQHFKMEIIQTDPSSRGIYSEREQFVAARFGTGNLHLFILVRAD